MVRIAALLSGLICALALTTESRAEFPRRTEASLDSALEAAKRNKTAVMIEFETQWCVACRDFMRTVLADKDVQNKLKEIAFLRYDAEGAEGREAAERYGVAQYPTVIAVNASGIEIFRWQYNDFRDPASFLKVIEATHLLMETEDELRQRLVAKTATADTYIQTAKWYAARREYVKAVKLLTSGQKIAARNSKERLELKRLADRFLRVDKWANELASIHADLVSKDYGNATVDDLVIATVESPLPEKEKRKLISGVLASRKGRHVVPFVYIALAAGFPEQALKEVEDENSGADNELLRALAECYYATGQQALALGALEKAAELAQTDEEKEDVKLDRIRIEGHIGESPQVIEERLRAFELRRHVEEIDQLRPIGRRDYKQRKLTQSVSAVMVSVGTDCKGHARGTDAAYVSFGVDNLNGRIVGVKLYLEDTSNDALVRCLQSKLEAAKLPTSSFRIPRQTLRIALGM